MDTRDWIIYILQGCFTGTKTIISYNTGEYVYNCSVPRAYFTDRDFLNQHHDYGMDKSLQCKKVSASTPSCLTSTEAFWIVVNS